MFAITINKFNHLIMFVVWILSKVCQILLIYGFIFHPRPSLLLPATKIDSHLGLQLMLVLRVNTWLAKITNCHDNIMRFVLHSNVVNTWLTITNYLYTHSQPWLHFRSLSTHKLLFSSTKIPILVMASTSIESAFSSIMVTQRTKQNLIVFQVFDFGICQSLETGEQLLPESIQLLLY